MAELQVSINETINNVSINEENVVVELGTSGPQGARGTGILNGTTAPSNNIGIIGDFYLNTTSMNLYGPKTSQGWGTPADLMQDAGNLGYVHIQEVSSTEWTINHGLGFMPNITVVDTAGTVVEGSYNYTNSNTVILSFIGAFSGRAYLS